MSRQHFGKIKYKNGKAQNFCSLAVFIIMLHIPGLNPNYGILL